MLRRQPSRRLPPATAYHATPLGVALSVSLVAGLAVIGVWKPWALLLILALGLAAWIGIRLETQRLLRLVLARPRDSICTFARAFDCRQVDTWIIRAVYEELQTVLPHGVRPFPIRAEDHLEYDLGIDHDTLEEVAEDVASRAGRSIKNGERNPYYDRIRRVMDLVYFLHHQPRLDGVELAADHHGERM